MPQVFQLLQSFSLVESLLSLVAFSVACVTAYLLIKHKSQAKLIPQIIEKAQTADQQALARDLMRVFPSQKAIKLSKDKRQVFIEVPSIQPVMQMKIGYDLESVEGEIIEGAVYNTIHELAPAFSGFDK